MNVHFPQHKAPPKPLSQAECVIERFGGAKKLSDALSLVGYRRTTNCIYRWTYPRERNGTGGLIPTTAWREILEAADYVGIKIESELMDLRNFP